MTFRFAILHHQFPAGARRVDHWDLLLELPPTGESPAARERDLMTFEVLKPPHQWGQRTWVQRLPDHRNIYLDYEGSISGGRGEVTRIFSGAIHWQVLEANRIVLEIDAKETANQQFMSGTLLLTKQSEFPEDKTWVMKLQP